MSVILLIWLLVSIGSVLLNAYVVGGWDAVFLAGSCIGFLLWVAQYIVEQLP